MGNAVRFALIEPWQAGRKPLGDRHMRVVGYLRVSTEEQARSGLGMEAQRATITAWADPGGHDVEWISDEGWSGKDTEWRGLTVALDMLRRGTIDALVVSKLDRLSRSMHDFSGLLETSRTQKWAVVALDMAIDTSTMVGRLVAHVLMSVAEFEREAIGQRTSDAIQSKLARGEDWGRRSQVDATVEATNTAMRAEGLSALSIARRLNAYAVPTVRGGTWHASTVARVLKRVERRTQRGSAA